MTAFQELARMAAERMLNGMIGGLAIALCAALVLQILSHGRIGARNSKLRFGILLATLFIIAIFPTMSLVRNGAAAASNGAVWAVALPGAWATYAVLAWAAMAAMGLARVAWGIRQLRRLKGESRVIDPVTLDGVLQRTLAASTSRKVKLAVSQELVVPAAIGFFDPMIVLPDWAIKELTTAQLNSILIHELAHLDRRDDWTNLAQKTLRAVFFFHPAVWWVERKLSLEREMACDDAVVELTENPQAYAECLVTVAEKSLMRRSLAMAQAAVSKMQQTRLRVTQILKGRRGGPTPMWKPAIGLATVASGLFVVGLAHTPELVAFRSPAVSFNVAAVRPGEVRMPVTVKPELAAYEVKPKKVGRHAARPVEARMTMQDPSTGAKLASAKQPEIAPARAVFVVMRTQQTGPDGANWTVQVWRFTVLKSEQIPIELLFPAKSL